jgi:hypothetical protein
MKLFKPKRDRDFDLLVDYLDGELSTLKQERLEARLKVEPELASRLRQLRALHADIRDLSNVAVPSNFTLGPEHKKQLRKGWSIWPIPQLVPTGRGGIGLRWVGYPVIAIAGVLVVLSSLSLYRSSSPTPMAMALPSPNSSPTRMAMALTTPKYTEVAGIRIESLGDNTDSRSLEDSDFSDANLFVPTRTAGTHLPSVYAFPSATQRPMETHTPTPMSTHTPTPMSTHTPTSTYTPTSTLRLPATSSPLALPNTKPPLTKPASIPTPTEWDGDACSMPNHSIHVTTDGSVFFNSSSDIAGFQFNVDGAAVLNASGGEAEVEDFSISASDTIVLGFSLAAATFDGCGTMVELSLDGEAIGLSGIIISDLAAEALPFEYFYGEGSGGE